MKYMNAALASQNASGMFVTFFYGVLDTRTGEIQFANAGHNPPYAFFADGTLRTLEDKGGPVLGLFPQLEYDMATARLAPGEGILVFTDGVTEARNPADEFFEEERLEAYLRAHASEPVEQLVSGLHKHLEDFASGAPQADDITALALRYVG